MKQTHKLRALGNVAAIVSSSPSVTAAAQRLGVNRSTMHRWIQAGKVPAPSGRSARPAVVAARPGQSPDQWARTVRRAYTLTATEQQLLTLATSALTLSRDDAHRPEVRLASMGRFQRLIQQMHLEAEQHGEAEAAAPADPIRWPRRA